MTTKPRKRAPKKAVAPAVDDPQTPFFDARAEDGTFAQEEEESPSAPEDQAVATEAASEDDSVILVDSAPALTVEQTTPVVAEAPIPRCVNCGGIAIYETDGRSSSKRAFCAKDLPANVTHAMVEAYRVRQRR